MVARKTDGYLTDDSAGDWRYSNTGEGSRGDVTTGDSTKSYARIERQDGAIEGTAVDALGNISKGPKIDFKTLDSLLAGAAPSQGAPSVVWAGVSPMSLSEALIVWNQEVVVLDTKKILGGQNPVLGGAITVSGRLMIVTLGDPLAIDGEEQATIIFQPGAVGVYGAAGAECSTSMNTTTGEPSGELEALPTPTAGGCNDPIIGGAGDDAPSGQGAQVTDRRLFAEQLCQDGGCDPTVFGDDAKLSFTVNNQMQVPVRCCHPFALLRLSLNGPDSEKCPCKDCPLWVACMAIYGSTIPGEVFPIDQLLEIPNPDQMEDMLTGSPSGTVPGTLRTDVRCCQDATVELVGNFGPAVTVRGQWKGVLPGIAGQGVHISVLRDVGCSGGNCNTTITPDDMADVWVAEGILKPRERKLPVAFFSPLAFTSTHIDLPKTLTTVMQTMVTACPSKTIYAPTDAVGNMLTTDPIGAVIGSLINGNNVFTEVPWHTPSTARWFVTCTGVTIDICVAGGSSMSSQFVVTNCSSLPVETTTITGLGTLKEVHAVPIGPLTVVTGCSTVAPTIALAQGGAQGVDILLLDEDGLIKLVTPATEQTCRVTWKFVQHPGKPLQWQKLTKDELLPCEDNNCHPVRTCEFTLADHPDEVDCKNVNLLSAIYLSSSEAPGACTATCPGYDCTDENPPVPPRGSNVPNLPSNLPQTCGILIRRPQRRPFVKCNNNTGIADSCSA